MLVRSLIMLLLMATLFSPIAVFAKPAAPEGFMEMFKSLQNFENAFEERNWSEAIENTKDLSSKFSVMQGNFNRLMPGASRRFDALIAQLQTTLKAKNPQSTNTAYVDMQKLILEISDHYEFRVHPIQFLIDDYLDEALAAAQSGDQLEIEDELEEIRDHDTPET